MPKREEGLTLKICTKCKDPKPETEYYDFRNGKYSICKTCCQIAARTRIRNKVVRGLCSRCVNRALPGQAHCAYCLTIENDRLRQRNRRVKEQAVVYKGGKCVDCGLETTHYSVYDFHHLDPTQKDFSMRDRRSHKFENIREELDKCILLCSNCHRVRHEGEEK